ncbi:endonuclease/exonuclease/phosphatase family protein [Kocuria kalidii]|uniref:endonuclease/exonuclease/phosphatase family protein n=1 Tax=Kocuria kalidii TaxID=3376283 RepID=UPI0037902F83
MLERRRRNPFGAAGRAALWVIIGTGLGLSIVLVTPHNLGLGGTYPIVQLESLRLGWIMALLLLIGMAAVLARHSDHGRGVRKRVLQVMVLLLIGAVLTESILFARAGGFLPARQAAVHAPGRDLTVLSFNARQSEADEIVEAAVAVQADVLLLVEVDAEIAAQIAESLHRRGLPNQLFTDSDKAVDPDATAIVTADRVGRYRQVAGPELAFGSVSVAPVDASRALIGTSSFTPPRLSAVHPPPPLPGRYSPNAWWRQLRLSVETCRPGESTIVGGDFNASTTHIGHLMDEGCVDAGEHLGRGAVGTWPRSLPAPLGASIDHQIADAQRWEPVGIQYLDIGESDHRALAVSYRGIALKPRSGAPSGASAG